MRLNTQHLSHCVGQTSGPKSQLSTTEVLAKATGLELKLKMRGAVDLELSLEISPFFKYKNWSNTINVALMKGLKKRSKFKRGRRCLLSTCIWKFYNFGLGVVLTFGPTTKYSIIEVRTSGMKKAQNSKVGGQSFIQLFSNFKILKLWVRVAFKIQIEGTYLMDLVFVIVV